MLEHMVSNMSTMLAEVKQKSEDWLKKRLVTSDIIAMFKNVTIIFYFPLKHRAALLGITEMRLEQMCRKRVETTEELQCTSAVDRITLVPRTDSAYRWSSWQVPVMTVRSVTTGGLSDSARSVFASAPERLISTRRRRTRAAQVKSRTRAMMMC